MDERGYQIPNNASPWSGLVIASTFEPGMAIALIACLGAAHLLKAVLSLHVQMPGLEPNTRVASAGSMESMSAGAEAKCSTAINQITYSSYLITIDQWNKCEH
jgi:hypothetical protein